jgi:glycosyl transferase family 25
MAILPGGDQQPPFDTLIINLDRDSGRLAGVMASCAAVGIKAERLAALTGDGIPARMRPWFETEDGRSRGAMLPGEIGCYASHLLAMEIAVARARPMLVLEDDAVLTPAMARLNDMMRAAPSDWGFLRLSSRSKQMCLRVGVGEGFDIVEYWHIGNFTAGYVVSPDGARQFLNAFRERARPVDEDMRRIWLHRVPSYGVVPGPVVHDGPISTIHPRGQRDQVGRAMGSMNGREAWAWRIVRWGGVGVLSHFGHGLLWTLRKRFGRRPAESDLVMDHPTRGRGR